MLLKINRYLLAVTVSVALASALQAQKSPQPAGQLSSEAIEKLHATEDTLAILAFAVVNDSIEQERFAACRSLITALVRALKTENSFQYRFERLKSVSILAPPDSSFRIFTWQMFVNDSTYRHYGAIQMNEASLKLYPLIDRSFEMEEAPVAEQLTPERWYGALYYNLRQFDAKEGRKYMLFGFDAFEFFEKRKVIDVLGFDASGKPFFGAPVFKRQGEEGPAEYRIVLQYSAETKVRCNWDDQYEMVLFDHLIPVPSPFGRGMTNVTDGSYEGFRYEKKRWKYIEKVFNDVMEEAPRPEPILDARSGKNIMGKGKKPKVQPKGGERP